MSVPLPQNCTNFVHRTSVIFSIHSIHELVVCQVPSGTSHTNAPTLAQNEMCITLVPFYSLVKTLTPLNINYDVWQVLLVPVTQIHTWLLTHLSWTLTDGRTYLIRHRMTWNRYINFCSTVKIYQMNKIYERHHLQTSEKQYYHWER